MKFLITAAGAALAAASALGVALAGFGSRWGWWYFRTGFSVLKWSAVCGLAAALVCALGVYWALTHRTQGASLLAAAGLFLGLLSGGVPAGWYRTAKRVPVINDITTDTQNPPPFRAVLPLRTEATSPADYPGAETAAQQLKANTGVKPLVTDLPPEAALDKALAAAREAGWNIVDVDRKEGRLEAVATTFWFGFHDDIVVRVTPDGKGSRVDMRSHSRVGRSDIGTNARRILAFLEKMRRP